MSPLTNCCCKIQANSQYYVYRYTCRNGHAFFVGECGMPIEEAMCSECQAPVGGISHIPAEGVTADEELTEQMRQLQAV